MRPRLYRQGQAVASRRRGIGGSETFACVGEVILALIDAVDGPAVGGSHTGPPFRAVVVNVYPYLDYIPVTRGILCNEATLQFLLHGGATPSRLFGRGGRAVQGAAGSVEVRSNPVESARYLPLLSRSSFSPAVV